MDIPEVTFCTYNYETGKMEPYKTFDNYMSLIWHEYYQEPGDFELYIAATDNILDEIIPLSFVRIKDHDETMIIEKIELKQEAGKLDTVIISGRSIIVLLECRMIATYYFAFYSTKIGDILRNVSYNIIIPSPTHPTPDTSFQSNCLFEKKINGEYVSNTILDIDSRLDSTYLSYYDEFSATGTNDTFYSRLKDLSTNYDFGFKTYIDNYDRIHISFYRGNDRSSSQNDYPPVIFSKKFDNLLTFKLKMSNENYKTSGLCSNYYDKAGTLESFDFNASYESGVNKREVFLYIKEDGLDPNLASYSVDGLTTYSKNYVANNYPIEYSVESSIDSNNQQFIYGKDYFLGDTVQVDGKFGVSTTLICDGVLYSYDTNKIEIVPEFSR